MAKKTLFIGDSNCTEQFEDKENWDSEFNFEENFWRAMLIVNHEEFFFKNEVDFKRYLWWLLSTQTHGQGLAKKNVSISYVRLDEQNQTLHLEDEVKYLMLLSDTSFLLPESTPWGPLDSGREAQSFAQTPHRAMWWMYFTLAHLLYRQTISFLVSKEVFADEELYIDGIHCPNEVAQFLKGELPVFAP